MGPYVSIRSQRPVARSWAGRHYGLARGSHCGGRGFADFRRAYPAASDSGSLFDVVASAGWLPTYYRFEISPPEPGGEAIKRYLHVRRRLQDRFLRSSRPFPSRSDCDRQGSRRHRCRAAHEREPATVARSCRQGRIAVGVEQDAAASPRRTARCSGSRSPSARRTTHRYG